MSAIVQGPRPASLNRRRRVRQKVHAPAYATFGGASKSEMLDLYEVLDISEVGVAVQCPSPVEVNRQIDLCLDLSEASGQILTPARVVWSDATGRVGLGFSTLKDPALHRLREWLFLNAMAGAANAASAKGTLRIAEVRPNYTDTLTAVSAVQREAESLYPNLEAVLSLIAVRSRSLLRASGAAIALAAKEPGTMICGASAGQSAPPVGATLQVGSGFSGECVLTGRVLRCDDTETDERVDRQLCRVLGIRSRLAAPVRSGEQVIGLLEVFSSEPHAFVENDGAVLQRFTETILAAFNRSAREDVPPVPPPSPKKPFEAAPGSILFAHAPAEKKEKEKPEPSDGTTEEEDEEAAIRLPRAHLYLLLTAAATVFLALGYISAPSLQPWIQQKLRGRSGSVEQTVLASSHPPGAPSTSAPSVDSANLEQLRELAKRGDPAAENALGLLYAQGDEKQAVAPNEGEAARWFTKAAEDGSVTAQYKLGLLYWGGHGVPKDPNRAYFWAVLARAGGQEGSKDLAKVLANGMTRAQTAAIEQQAEMWYQQRESHGKPQAGH